MSPRVILLAKQERFSREASAIAEAAFGADVATYTGAVGDPEPEALRTGSPEYLISFLSPWIVRKPSLDRAGTAINFHPGSTDYPGIGCYNFALYEGATEFGAVCHHMLAKVDTGELVMERRFPVLPEDSVETLKLRTMETMIDMFREIVALIAAGQPLPRADAHWTRRPFTRREMEALKVIEHDMPQDEIDRRVRATVYPGYPGPVMRLPGGGTYAFPVPDRPPIA
jgi:methionyl-tRNA formyltransferase